MTQIQPHSKKWANLGSSTRFYIITGGRGSGKSFEVTRFINILTFGEGNKILYTRKTMTSAHLSIIPEFVEKMDLLDVKQYFEINKSEIKNKLSGSEVLFRGLKTSSGDQTANLKSLQGVNNWVLDEAEELTDEKTFDTINLSVRDKGQQNRVILILNPTTRDHWIYKRFFEECGVEPNFTGVKGNVTYIHSTYLDNYDNLPEDYINEIEHIRDTNPDKYEHVILGSWLQRAEGTVFTNWTLGKFNPDSLQVSYGQDYGYSIDPSTLAAVSIDKTKRRIYVKELLYKTQMTTSEIAAANRTAAGNGLIVADSAEPRLIAELQKMGNKVIPTRKGAGSIAAGISLMQDYEIVVDPNSINIIKELNNYVYADRGSKLYVDNHNHLIDAIRYNVSFHLGGGGKADVR